MYSRGAQVGDGARATSSGEFVFVDLNDESLSGIVANVKEFLRPFILPTSVGSKERVAMSVFVSFRTIDRGEIDYV